MWISPKVTVRLTSVARSTLLPQWIGYDQHPVEPDPERVHPQYEQSVLQPVHTGSFPTKKPHLEQPQPGPGSGPLEIIRSKLVATFSLHGSGPTCVMPSSEAKRDTRPKISFGRSVSGRGHRRELAHALDGHPRQRQWPVVHLAPLQRREAKESTTVDTRASTSSGPRLSIENRFQPAWAVLAAGSQVDSRTRSAM